MCHNGGISLPEQQAIPSRTRLYQHGRRLVPAATDAGSLPTESPPVAFIPSSSPLSMPPLSPGPV